MMRIAIDAHSLGRKLTGNETYAFNLIQGLAKIDDQNQYLIYLTQDSEIERLGITRSNFDFKIIKPENPFIRIPISFPWKLWKDRAELAHFQYVSPPVCPCPQVLMVHDIAYHFFPQWYHSFEQKRLKLLTPFSMKKASRILVDSETTKKDITEVYEIEEQKIVVTPLGVSKQFRKIEDSKLRNRVRQKYNLPEEFILYVGNIQPRKNLIRLIEAFCDLKRNRVISGKLVIVGKKPWLYLDVFRTVREQKIENEIIFTDYVDDEDLPVIYNLAQIFIYPSLYEGFGLPPLEAMACGVPVITSDISSIREFAQGAAFLIDPKDKNKISAGIKELLSNESLQEELSQKGFKRAQKYSWEETAEKTLKVFEKVLKR